MKLLLLYLKNLHLAKALSSGIGNVPAASVLLDSGNFFLLILQIVLADIHSDTSKSGATPSAQGKKAATLAL